jgi:hypothetical protein
MSRFSELPKSIRFPASAGSGGRPGSAVTPVLDSRPAYSSRPHSESPPSRGTRRGCPGLASNPALANIALAPHPADPALALIARAQRVGAHAVVALASPTHRRRQAPPHPRTRPDPALAVIARPRSSSGRGNPVVRSGIRAGIPQWAIGPGHLPLPEPIEPARRNPSRRHGPAISAWTDTKRLYLCLLGDCHRPGKTTFAMTWES